VYILTSSNTASASELIINGLKPYMDVYLIGDVTVGKNVGSITITDEENKDNQWGMQPIVVKLLNSLGKADFDNGFNPDLINYDNDLILYPLGDERETMLADAISIITATPPPVARKTQYNLNNLLYSSFANKKWSERSILPKGYKLKKQIK
jgi:C-terminal processing protease CtpA/Prc